MEQEIRYLKRPDGVRIAYSILGEGPPVIRLVPWGHLEAEWDSPPRRAGIERFAAFRTWIDVRFD